MALASFLAACGGSGSASDGPGGGQAGHHHPLQRPARADHPALIAAFERQTGIHVKERDGDEDALAEQIEQEGRRPRPTCSSPRTLRPSCPSRRKGCWRPSPASALSQVPAQYSSPQGDWVGVVGPGQRARLQHLPAQPVPAADFGDGPGQPRVEGKAGSGADARPTSSRSSPRSPWPTASRPPCQWLKAVAANASSHIDPDNETVTADVNSGQAAIGLINHYYWFRLARSRTGTQPYAFPDRLLRPR